MGLPRHVVVDTRGFGPAYVGLAARASTVTAIRDAPKWGILGHAGRFDPPA